MTKNFFQKVQDLTRKAAEIQQAVQSAPAKAAELRQAVRKTAVELKQLKTDLHSSLAELQDLSPESILETMNQLTENTELFYEAGYELRRMELEVGEKEALLVHLMQVKEVPLATISHLLEGEVPPSVKIILLELTKTRELCGGLVLRDLQYDGVVIELGSRSSIRVQWRSTAFISQEGQQIFSGQSARSKFPNPTMSSFFEASPLKPAAPVRATQPDEVASQNTVTTSSSVTLQSAVKKETGGDPLARFKQMPKL